MVEIQAKAYAVMALLLVILFLVDGGFLIIYRDGDVGRNQKVLIAALSSIINILFVGIFAFLGGIVGWYQ